MRRFDQRQSFLVSAAVHLTLLMILVAHPPSPRALEEIDPATLEKRDLVFLPPPAVIRQLVPSPPPAAVPRPVPSPMGPRPTPPPPDAGRDRISVGPRLPFRNEGPLNLDSIGKVPKGTQTEQLTPKSGPTPAAPAAPPPPIPEPPATTPRVADAGVGREGRPGLTVPPGLGATRADAGEEAGRRPGLSGSALDRIVEEATRRAAEGGGSFGLPEGKGADISGLHFDPQGADFTVWISHLAEEFRRNFVVPQTAYLGFRGRAVIRFVVERDGSLSSVATVQSTGTASLDRAVSNAISGSRYLPLPADYRPPNVTFHLIFDYR